MNITIEARRQTIQSLLKARQAESGEAETLPIQWKGKSKILPVILFPVTDVLLNNNSHRIRANLESHEMAEKLNDPHTLEAQEVIEAVIRDQPGYDDLLENLRIEGQRDAGVMTVDGVLINANRRAVALRDIDPKSYIKVAILPEDSTPEEEIRLELKLQMQQEFKQSYTFTNELLFIEDLGKQRYSTAQIAKELRWKEQEVQQHQQMLAIIRDLQQRCGPSLKLIAFDENRREIMIELNKKLQQLERTDPRAAERLLINRAVAMFTDVGYELIREIDEDFLPNHLLDMAEEMGAVGDGESSLGTNLIAKHFPEIVAGGQDAATDVEGLDVLGGEAGNYVDGSNAVLEFYFDSMRDGSVEIPGTNGMRCDKEVLHYALKDLIISAAVEARESRRHDNDLNAPMNYLEEARKKVKKARERLDRAKEDSRFNAGDYQLKMRRLANDVKEAHDEAKQL